MTSVHRAVGLGAVLGASALVVGCTVGMPSSPSATSPTPAEQSATTTNRDVWLSESIDIGEGRRLFLECVGSGGPTVLLESGIHDSSDYWVSAQPDAPAIGPSVFDSVSAVTTVCRYDRPGTLRPLDSGPIFTDRSTPVGNPRTIDAVAADLEALIEAAGLEGPFVLVGHSFGGWLQTYYAQTHPAEVAGLVLVDAFSSRMVEFMGEAWPAYEPVLNSLGGNPLENDPASEQYDVPASVLLSDAAPALRTDIPVAVLSKTEPFPLPADIAFTSEQLETAWRKVQDALALLVPHTPHVIAEGSDHYIQIREPDLVSSTIRLVLERARARLAG
ncbi:MAG TPA: alpha/beta hydrolase [Microbacterium sp.]|nr:alpha/beta hydrolase [Microbacterium sp.]